MIKRKESVPKFVNPFTDIGFKIIFGQPASKKLLITLLNELLQGEHYIEDLCFLDKEDHAENVNERGIIYDLYCRTSSGEYIIVEMQNRRHSHFLNRTLYYVCRAIGRLPELPPADEVEVPTESGVLCEAPMSYGKRYKLNTVYGIFLMNFREDGLENKFRTDVVITDRETGKVVHPCFRQIYLQFPCFTKELSTCETLYEKLIYALKYMNQWDRMPKALKGQVFQHLAQLAAVANLSEANRIAYDKAVDLFWINRTVDEDIREEGREEGKKEGRKKGLEEGMKKSMRKIAISLKQDGMPLSTISKHTGLSVEEIASL